MAKGLDKKKEDKKKPEKTLKENIKKVQGKGGRVTLYFEGRLMDTGSDFYRETGRRIESKTRWGTPYYEYDDKYCHSDYLHYFSKKPFAVVCPSCEEWHELMARRADWIHSLGADGILYDQIGGMPPFPIGFIEESLAALDRAVTS